MIRDRKHRKKREIHGAMSKNATIIQRKIYNVYSSIKSRCYNNKDQRYRTYGNRGIEMCTEWYNSFKSFYEWALKNGYSIGLSIDRINNNGNYEPDNCRIIPRNEQSKNTTKTKYHTLNNVTKTLADWGRYFGISSCNAKYRIEHNWPFDKIFELPSRGRRIK